MSDAPVTRIPPKNLIHNGAKGYVADVPTDSPSLLSTPNKDSQAAFVVFEARHHGKGLGVGRKEDPGREVGECVVGCGIERGCFPGAGATHCGVEYIFALVCLQALRLKPERWEEERE